MDIKDLNQSKKHFPSFKMPFTPKSRLKGNLKYERKFYLDISSWKDMKERIHLKRRVLVSNLLHDIEAGAYLGNSEAVNYNHYTPVSLETIGAKLRGLGDRKMISQLVA